MNRRAFLKSLIATCGAAVVCPGELLRSEPDWVKYARCFRPEHKIMLDKLRTAASGKNVICKARQQGCTNSILYGIPYYFRGVPLYYQENLSA